ncbi:hypothetical protein ACFQ22_10235 [Lentilactobacillus raoultii]|uniref:DUF3021 family protein n=1 Tax=Lentilactobacillus raoultii TaxID=1987503 RepID=A0ABW3PKA5_9LACO|nr:hypothetical protein [Lentilactobacillus raoultii]
MASTIRRYRWLSVLDVLGILMALLFAFFLNTTPEKKLIFFVLASGSLIISVHSMTYLIAQDRKGLSNSKLGRRVAFGCDILFTFIFFSFQSIKLPDYLQAAWTISYLVCTSSFFLTIFFLVYWITSWVQRKLQRK